MTVCYLVFPSVSGHHHWFVGDFVRLSAQRIHGHGLGTAPIMALDDGAQHPRLIGRVLDLYGLDVLATDVT